MTEKTWKERHLYYFHCAGCGKRRVSFKRSRARLEQCRNCRRQSARISPGQESLL